MRRPAWRIDGESPSDYLRTLGNLKRCRERIVKSRAHCLNRGKRAARVQCADAINSYRRIPRLFISPLIASLSLNPPSSAHPRATGTGALNPRSDVAIGTYALAGTGRLRHMWFTVLGQGTNLGPLQLELRRAHELRNLRGSGAVTEPLGDKRCRDATARVPLARDSMFPTASGQENA